MIDKTIEEIVNKIRPLINSDRCVVWVGSGLSIPAGYPDWRETIDKLCEACQVENLKPSCNESEELIVKADECKNKNSNAFNKTIIDLFGKEIVTTRQAYNLLLKLPFKAYVTTNFDKLLSEAASLAKDSNSNKKHWFFSYPLLSPTNLGEVDQGIFYLHGWAGELDDDQPEFILAKSDFDNAYSPGGTLFNFIYGLWFTYHILFLGCGLQEPQLYETFQRLRKVQNNHAELHPRYDPSSKKKIMLLPELESDFLDNQYENREREKRKEAEDNYFKSLSIEIIRYPRDESHSKIEDILKTLCGIVRPSPSMSFGEETPL